MNRFKDILCLDTILGFEVNDIPSNVLDVLDAFQLSEVLHYALADKTVKALKRSDVVAFRGCFYVNQLKTHRLVQHRKGGDDSVNVRRGVVHHAVHCNFDEFKLEGGLRKDHFGRRPGEIKGKRNGFLFISRDLFAHGKCLGEIEDPDIIGVL